MVTASDDVGYIWGTTRVRTYKFDVDADDWRVYGDDFASYRHGAGFFASKGAINGEIITRMGLYEIDVPAFPDDVADDGDELSYYIGPQKFSFQRFFIFDSGDFDTYPGETLGSAAFVAEAWDEAFPEPTPGQICNAPGVQVYRSTFAGRTTPGTHYFGGGPEYEDLDPNTKYWVVVAPVVYDGTDNIPMLPVNDLGRGLSFWTARSPEKPTITSPVSGTVIPAGQTVPFSFKPNHPDALFPSPTDIMPWVFRDLAGQQVQYRAKPTPTDPDPEWEDLPICTVGDDPSPERGWFIENADGAPADDGAERLRETLTMPLLGGAPNDFYIRGAGMLPSGNWQIRVRTFNYGHPYATLARIKRNGDDSVYSLSGVTGYGPLGTKGADTPDIPGEGTFPETDYTPDDFPEINTSPWSDPINVLVTTQVPPVTLISPINNMALAEDATITLRWKYRNTGVPPKTQLQRQVQIRKVGEADWTTLASGYSDEEFYEVEDPNPNGSAPTPDPPPDPPEYPRQYLSDLGFEGGTLDGWEAGGDATITNLLLPGAWHDGSDRGLIVTTEASTLQHSFIYRSNLHPADEYFTISGWSYKGPDTTHQRLVVMFMEGNLPDLGTPVGSSFLNPVLFDDGAGWKYAEAVDLLRPEGASQVAVFVSSDWTEPGPVGEGDAIDDFSVMGSPHAPVIPPEPEPEPPLPDLVLPDVDPIEYDLEATTQYEWRVRVTDTKQVTSEWSAVGRFWVVPTPNSGEGGLIPSGTIDGATLGCGRHTVEIYRRGGKTRVGVLDGVASVDWERKRDDISTAKIVLKDWSSDCGNLLSKLQSWAYEVVIHRDNGYESERVWEGPISLITDNSGAGEFTIDAKDVINFVYRRIIKQEMNDTGTSPTAGTRVTDRAARVLQNCLAPDDPNVLAYLTIMTSEQEAVQYRNLPPYSRTGYEEIDDMAANAGLDYCAVGRRIILWGTKHRIGTLPEFRDEHLGARPIVSEYGMSAANVYAVSDGNGIYGEADRLDEFDEDPIYGLIEVLSSSWASDSAEEEGTYTQEGLETVRASFAESAEHSIASRWPPPVVVRVPDNTTLNPNTPVSIKHLVPGVVIPLRSTTNLRHVKSNQKLDYMKVVESDGKETITITMSPFSREDTEVEEG